MTEISRDSSPPHKDIDDFEKILWQKETYKKFMDLADVILLSLDCNGNVKMINKKGCELLGYRCEEMIGKNWFDNYLPEKVRAEVRSFFDSLISRKTGIVENYENTVITCSGEEKIIVWHSNLLEDDKGNIIGVIASGKNVTEMNYAKLEMMKNYDIQQTINFILQIFLENLPLEKLLEQVMDTLLSISWLALESKGCIFLADKDDPDFLIMKAQKNLATPLLTLCARIKKGQCLCGTSALTKQIVFENSLNEHHAIRYDGIKPHGHYCIPIVSNGEVLGVLNTYVKHGFERNKRVEEFLSAVANALAGVLKRKEVEQNLLLYQKRLESKIKEFEKFHSITVDRELKMIEMKQRIKSLEESIAKKEASP